MITTSATNPTESPNIQILMLDLKDEYNKVQTRSQGTTRMRVARGEVNGMVRTTGEIKSIKAFVQRTPEAAKEVNDTTGLCMNTLYILNRHYVVFSDYRTFRVIFLA